MRTSAVAGMVAGFALLALPSALGAAAVVSAAGTITGPGADGYMTLTVRNTGDQPIRCFRLAVPTSVKVVGARTVPGWSFVSSSSPPSPDIGLRALGTLVLALGGEVQLVFRTEPQFPANAAATLVVSESAACTPVVKAPVTGPGQASPPPPPKKCRCTKLTAKIDPSLLQERRLAGAKQDFGIGFSWTMTCDAGAGGCRGRIDFLPPEVIAGSLPKPRGTFRLNIRRATIACVGQCNRTQPGRFEVKMRSSRQLNVLFGRTLAFRIRLFCIVDGQPVPAGQRTVRVRVDQTGRLRVP